MPGRLIAPSDILTAQGALGAEGLANRCRRLMAQAARGNPILLPALVGSVAWSAGEVVTAGAVRSNDSGKAYICTTGGTCAGSGGPTGYGSAITDNTATWAYYGPQTAPLFYARTDVPASTTVTISKDSPALRYGGGQIVGNSGGYALWCVSADPTSNATGALRNTAGGTQDALFGVGSFIEFETDAPVICFDLKQNTAVAINALVTEVGRGAMQYVSDLTIFPNTTGTAALAGHSLVVLDFTNCGGRRPRRIRLEMGSTVVFFNLRLGPNDTISAPSTANRLKFGFLGDSWTEGNTQTVLGRRRGFAEIMSWLLGADECLASGASGTGFISTTTTYTKNFQQRVSDVASPGAACDIIFIMGGVNDGAATTAQIQAAAAACITGIRALSTAPIVFLGCNAPNDLNNVSVMLPRENAIAAAVAASGDAKTYFVPAIGASPAAFITGSGKAGSLTGSGNGDVYITSGNHLNDAGYLYYGRRYAQLVAQIIQSAAWN